jgi:hypothetical protein
MSILATRYLAGMTLAAGVSGVLPSSVFTASVDVGLDVGTGIGSGSLSPDEQAAITRHTSPNSRILSMTRFLTLLGFRIRRQSYYLFPNPTHSIVQKDTNIVQTL